MNKLFALLQMLAAIALGILAIATSINSVLISTRPETISVVNAIIGQWVVIVALMALATVLFQKALRNLRQEKDSQPNQD